MNKARLEKILLAGIVIGLVVVKGTILSEVDAKASKYGTDGGNTPAAVEKTAEEIAEEKAKSEEAEIIKKGQILDAEHEAGKANGTAGDTFAPAVNSAGGNKLNSSVKGCYNTRDFGGAVSVVDTSGAQNMIGKAVDLKPNEESYAYIMDSQCGDIAKGVLLATAASYGYLPGPIIDINIGKKTAAGQIVYPDKFQGNGGVIIGYDIPAGYRMPGYETAYICLLPDGSTELIPNLAGDGLTYGSIYVDHPQGVYMLTQVPAGSIDSLHNQRFQKMFSYLLTTS